MTQRVASCLLLMLLASPAFAQEAKSCHQSLHWFDQFVMIPFASGAGFRDAVSTVGALQRMQTAREANPYYRVTGADPRTHPERFAWLIGGSTAGIVTTAGTYMASCSAKTRWLGRLIAGLQGGKGVWVARRNDRIGR